MRTLGDYHTHSTLDDGKNTLAEMAQAAFDLGLPCLGFSGHSYGPQDTDFCIPQDKIPLYLAQARALEAEYRGRMDILVGLELDYFGQKPQGLDYVIGSVHSVERNGVFYPVDDSPQASRKAVDEAFGGDWYRLTDAYFDLVADLPRKTGCSWIGHFDLVTKFNEKEPAFNESSPRYLNRAKEVMAALVEQGIPFEVNTGAISRSWRSLPYPGPALLTHLHQLGGQVILTSDAHTAKTLCFAFDQAAEQLRRVGFTHTLVWSKDGPREVPL